MDPYKRSSSDEGIEDDDDDDDELDSYVIAENMGTPIHFTYEEYGCTYIFKVCLNLLDHVLIGIVAVHFLWPSRNEDYATPFPWHVTLCSLGVLVLLSESILVYNPINVWSSLLTRSTKRIVHWSIGSLGTICSIAGIATEINHKTKIIANNLPHYSDATLSNTRDELKHFASPHAILGLVTVLLVCLAFLTGIVTLHRRVCCAGRMSAIMVVHNMTGILCFGMAMISFTVSCYSGKWFVLNSTPALRLALCISVTCIIILTVYWAIYSTLKRIIIV